MTTILTKKKDTTGAPAPGDLTNAAGGAELAVNTFDKRLYTKDSGGNVVEIGTNPTILNIDNIEINGNTISSTNTNGNINLTPNGTGNVVAARLAVSSLTSGRVVYAGTSGLLTDSANLTFNGTTLTANTIGAFTLGGTIAGGGNQINNIVIGASTPLAGSFTTLSASGVATFSAGTVSAPAITTTGDTNTGIFFPAADTIAFTEGGVEAMRIDSSGNVGIGNTPAGNLDVGSTSNSFTQIIIRSSTSGTSELRFADTTVNAGFIAYDNSVDGMRFGTSTIERMRISSAGDVGIGLVNPIYNLDVYKSTNDAICRVRTNGSGAWFFADSVGNDGFFGLVLLSNAVEKWVLGSSDGGTSLNFVQGNRSGGTKRMVITAGGNVAIGSSSLVGNEQVNISFNSAVTTTTQALNTKDTNPSANNNSHIVLRRSDDTYLGSLGRSGTNAAMFIDGNGYLEFRTVSTERMRITSGGLVGIGTTGPIAQFQIYSGNQAMRIEQRGNACGKMSGKYYSNGGTGGQTINLFTITNWSSVNSRIFGKVTVTNVNAVGNDGNQETLYFGKSQSGTTYVSSATVTGSWGSIGSCSLSWSGDTLRLITSSNIFAFGMIDIEYAAGDGAAVAFNQ